MMPRSTPMAVATQSADSKHNVQAARQAYYDKAAKFNMAPLWEVLKDLVTPEPKTRCVPAIWKFADVKRLMLEAGDVITAEEAERRVLVLENPGEKGRSRITNSLFAGIQLIMPGEIADVHRHVASAIRFVLEGEGAYTAVEGEKTMMKHGDFMITATPVANRSCGSTCSTCRPSTISRRRLPSILTRKCRKRIMRTATRFRVTRWVFCRMACRPRRIGPR